MTSKSLWTPYRLGILVSCWKCGETAASISKILGCSRNAVIGKLNYLGLLGGRK